MEIANNWKDYEIIDMANGEKLERWGDIYLVRPDPQIIWKEKIFPQRWKNINAKYNRSKTGGGNWEYINNLPKSIFLFLSRQKPFPVLLYHISCKLKIAFYIKCCGKKTLY